MKACQACGGEDFLDLKVEPFYSRVRDYRSSKWAQCTQCLSVHRSGGARAANDYSPSGLYMAREHQYRIRGIERLLRWLRPYHVIFDIGSGPGIVAKLLRDRGL